MEGFICFTTHSIYLYQVLDKVFTQVPDIELVDNFLVFVVILCKLV